VSPSWFPAGNANYEALQAMFQKRFTGGTSFMASYTWSNEFDNVFDGLWSNNSGVTNDTVRNYYCLECEYHVSSYDVPQRFVLSWESALPFGSGKLIGSSWKGVTNAVLGGWQANGILTLESGMPLEFTTAENTSYSNGGNQHPNLVPGVNPVLSNPTISEWFNRAAFAQPANFTFGTMGITYTGVRNPWTRDIDFSLFKNYNFKERYILQFRAEAFNLFNTVIFGAPDTTVGSSGFGIISGQANSPRTFQLALKLMF
jgi:hypothetical protein